MRCGRNRPHPPQVRSDAAAGVEGYFPAVNLLRTWAPKLERTPPLRSSALDHLHARPRPAKGELHERAQSADWR